MLKQVRIAFGLKMGSSILTLRSPQGANAPGASLEARWRDRQFGKWAGLFPLEYIPLTRQGPEKCWDIWDLANVLVKMALRKIIPNDHI